MRAVKFGVGQSVVRKEDDVCCAAADANITDSSRAGRCVRLCYTPLTRMRAFASTQQRQELCRACDWCSLVLRQLTSVACHAPSSFLTLCSRCAGQAGVASPIKRTLLEISRTPKTRLRANPGAHLR